jgi:estrogen-related receptor beta like 1
METNVVCIVTELKKVGVIVESPAKLKQAHGDAVCIALDKLLDIAVEKTGIKLKSPSIPTSMIYSEDEDVDEDEEIEDELDNQEESDEEEMYTLQTKSDKTSSEKRNQVIESDVNAQEWKLELEQVAPQLILRLHVDHKDWRTHVESISDQEKTITDLMPDTTEKLNKISEEISKVSERISKREKMLSEDGSVSALLLSFKKNQEELETITSQYKEYEENISTLSNELVAVSSELEDVKNESDSLRKKLGDTTPLNQIKEATTKLKQEIKVMDLRSGVLTDSLLQAKIKTTRAMSASSQRRKINGSGVTISEFGFDPFAVNNNSSFLEDGYAALD